MVARRPAPEHGRRRVPGAALLRFGVDELRSGEALRAPGLLARGFHSDRRWRYPTDPRGDPAYISDLTYERVVRTLNPPGVQQLLKDKLAFSALLREAGMAAAIPATIAVVRDGKAEMVEGDHGGPLVVKPVAGRAGRGLRLVDSVDEAVAGCPAEGTYLVQARVRPHPWAAAIFAGSLNTLRVQVVRDSGGAVAVAVATHRFGTARSAPIDAFSQGGLVARVDLDAATLSPALAGRVRARAVVDDHPDTGARIAGSEVPRFDEVLSLARRLMALVPDARWVGWDLALSADGVVVTEGNASWPNLANLQAHGPFATRPETGRFFAETGLLTR